MTTTASRPTTAGHQVKRPIMQVRIQQILAAHDLWDRWQAGEIDYVKLENRCYMPLVISRDTTLTGDGITAAVTVMHYFVQNGDVMQDPGIVFTADEWEATEITQHPVGMYRAKYNRNGRRMMIDTGFYRNVQPLVRVWAANLKAQGWADPSCTTVKVAQ